MERIVWIDYAKALGIYLVILAHTQIEASVTNWISVFRMPLFFFLSGYLFSFERNKDSGVFVKKRFRQIVVPYIWLNIISYVFWFFISRNHGFDDQQAIAWYEPLVAALFCNGKGMIHNVPLWFFLCLFIVEMVFYFLFRPMRRPWRYVAAGVFALLGYVNYRFIPIVLPFSIGTALVGIAFYFLGNEVRWLGEKSEMKGWKNGTTVLLSFAIVTLSAIYNDRVYLYCNQYGNYLVFIVAALCGICMMKGSCEWLSEKIGRSKTAEYISKNTLLICGFHLMCYTIIKGIAVYIIGLPLDVFVGSIPVNILLSIGGILMCTPIIYIVNKYFPFLIGKKA